MDARTTNFFCTPESIQQPKKGESQLFSDAVLHKSATNNQTSANSELVPKKVLPQKNQLGLKNYSNNKTGNRPKNRRAGQEVIKSGMAGSLAVSMLTGLKILRPMSIHPVASWIFLGLTIVHTLMYSLPKKKPS